MDYYCYSSDTHILKKTTTYVVSSVLFEVFKVSLSCFKVSVHQLSHIKNNRQSLQWPRVSALNLQSTNYSIRKERSDVLCRRFLLALQLICIGPATWSIGMDFEKGVDYYTCCIMHCLYSFVENIDVVSD